MAQILRSGAASYVREHAGGGACRQVQSTLAKLSLCRTPALGGRSYQCDDCGEVSEVFHSCGDRHCPQCAGRKRYDFAARAERLILPKVTYYQVVFTLPSELSELALANRLEIADLLFASAWKSLRKTIRLQQGYDPAAMMVLHTWNQRLEPHWHAHALVPAGGPSLTGNYWQASEAPEEAANSDGHYLVDAISLRESFRRHAIAHLKRLRFRGESDDPPREEAPLRCPACDAPALQLIREKAKPCWPELLDHLDPRCPSWYAETGREEQRQYLLQAYRVDYEDWYRETRLESAMDSAAEPPPTERYLPAMYPVRDFALESF